MKMQKFNFEEFHSEINQKKMLQIFSKFNCEEDNVFDDMIQEIPKKFQ